MTVGISSNGTGMHVPAKDLTYRLVDVGIGMALCSLEVGVPVRKGRDSGNGRD